MRTVPTLVALTALAALAHARQSLLTYDATLTTYLPTAGTPVQGARPLALQRGVQLDGSARAGSAFGWSLAANPLEPAGFVGQRFLGEIDLAAGAYAPTEFDLSLPAAAPWAAGRTFNHRQSATNNGFQGRNWFQMGQPELVFVDDEDNAKDVVYLVYGADRFLEFRRQSATSGQFRGVNGAAGVVDFAAGTPDLWVYYDQRGTRTWFFGGNTADHKADWQVWKSADPAGNTAYAGHATAASTAVADGYDAGGRIALAFDSADRRYTYTYASAGGGTRLTQVRAETKAGGTWASPTGVAEVGRVDYAYYESDSDAHGKAGDLKLVTVTTPLSDAGVSLARSKYYRYYDESWADTDGRRGSDHQIKMVVGFEGTRRYDWEANASMDGDYVSATDAQLKPYSEAYLEYDTSGRVASVFFNGACGCSGGSNGVHKITYGTNGSFSDTAGYDTAWHSRAVVEPPAGGAWATQYFDETGQPLSRVVSSGNPTGTPTHWPTEVIRDGAGRTGEVRTVEAISAYTHSSGSFTASSGAGLIHTYSRLTTGDLAGFLEDRRWKVGTAGTAYLDGSTAYTTATKSVGNATVIRPLVVSEREFPQAITSGTTGSTLTELDYTFHAGDASLMPKRITTTLPAVSAGNNGSGSSAVTRRYLRADESTALTESATGVFTYSKRDAATGLPTQHYADVKTNGSVFAAGDDPNTDFGITETGDGLNVVTGSGFDAQGRSTSTTKAYVDSLPALSSLEDTMRYYSRLADGRSVTIALPRRTYDPDTYFGPATYTVSNQAGRAEFTATVAVDSNGVTADPTTWIDETQSNPLAALSSNLGTIARLSTAVHGPSGSRLDQSRAYSSIPASGSFPGTEGTHYDATRYGYDNLGRTWRVKQPSGTIVRTVFDARGQATETWMGTNDSSFSGGEESGSDTMTKVATAAFDAAGRPTAATQDADGDWGTTGDQRTTTTTYDARGRAVLVVAPQAPHTVSSFDNLGRVVAVGQYGSSSGLSASTDPTSASTNRLALAQTFYDERGRAWKTQRHKVDPSTGSDDDTLAATSWYDPDGRTVKTAGPSITKTRYDRLGRATHQFTLASDDDGSTYSNVWQSSGGTQLGGDIVLEEQQTIYASAADHGVVARIAISRNHDDLAASGGGRTGPLDSNGDNNAATLTGANVKGRVAITEMWYDAWNRLADTVALGTKGIIGDGSTTGGDWSRSTSPPARSDTALRTSYAYNADGSLLEVTDPKGLKARTLYDQAGRTVATISNYVDGTPSGANAADDNYVRVTYANGLQTELWVDLDGDGVQDADDQVTTYTYGTAKGTLGSGSPVQSQVATGHLLYQVTYPDSTGSSDVVRYAYNALSEQVWQKDQAGNVIETTLDSAGRPTARRVTTLISGFDAFVRRINLAYDGLSRVSTVKQNQHHDDSGTIRDAVRYTYDGWGNLAKFEQDVDSDFGAGGRGIAEVRHTYEKATPSGGRQTVRRSRTETFLGSAQHGRVDLDYLSTSDRLDDAAGRVSRLRWTPPQGSTAVEVAAYDYLGAANLVGTTLAEINAFNRFFRGGGSSGKYPQLDRFGRVTTSNWWVDNGGAVDVYKTLIQHDRNSNITLVDDQLTAPTAGTGWDVQYTMDDLNRLTRAREGSWVTGSLSSFTRDEQWTLSRTGNWGSRLLDLNGDGDSSDADEFTDAGTFNRANELTQRALSGGVSATYSPSYDEVGNLVNDGKDYTYEYDGFGRLWRVRNRSTSALVAEYSYNGLGFRTSWKYDADASGTVDGSDPVYWFTHDDRWRIVATYRGSDADPREVFVWHAAGLDGGGGSSYIDGVVLRQDDSSTAWTAEPDVLGRRVYPLQNWRADVVAVHDGGMIAERVKYSAYGVPFCVSAADFDADGDVDSADGTAFYAAQGAEDPSADLNLDGVVDFNDILAWIGVHNAGETGGRSVLSRASIRNRIGYAGYQHDPSIAGSGQASGQSKYHVRYRVYDASIGRWTRRDPLGYVDGMSLYEYVASRPMSSTDARGLSRTPCGGATCAQPIPTIPVEPPRPPPLNPNEPAPVGPGVPVPKCEFESNPAHSRCQGYCRLFTIEDKWAFTLCTRMPGKPPPGAPPYCCVCDATLRERHSMGFLKILPAVDIVAACFEAHEQTHMQQCVDPHSWCYHFSSSECSIACRECEAYAAEVLCLMRGMDRCGADTICRSTVNHYLQEASARQQEHCDRTLDCILNGGHGPR